MNDSAPLILTLAFDDASFAFFDEQRRRYFPADRNLIPAHLTLFHHLPGNRVDAVIQDLAGIGRRYPRFGLDVTGLRLLGRGVAYRLESVALNMLRQELAARWLTELTPQDRQAFKPHVTVQNKVEPAEAKALLSRLEATFAPFTATGEGLHLWRYRGGPWDPVATIAFAVEG